MLIGGAVLLAASIWDVSYVEFYADDLIFLDAARRFPPEEVLVGQHGIYPWYRPLSREIYFYLSLASETFGRGISATISVVTLAFACAFLFRIGRDLKGETVGAIAVTLFLVHNLTKFLTAWASGYQDLLSITLVLGAVSLEISGKSRRAVLFAALAPFAKETGLIAFPMILASHVLRVRTLPLGRYLLGLSACCAMVIALHLWVRTAWETEGSRIAIESDPTRLIQVLIQAVSWFLSIPHRADPTAVAMATIAAAGAATFLIGAERAESARESSNGGRSGGLVVVLGIILGFTPVVVGNLLEWSVPKSYYAFPAIPWIALGAAWVIDRLPRGLALLLPVGLVLSNVSALHYQPPDLDKRSSWVPGPPSWWEAVRVSALTERFREDLHRIRGHVTEHGTILYTRLPTGSFFLQSGDGAATRELLGDPSVRAYFLGDAPIDFDPHRATLVAFDATSGHLRILPRTSPGLIEAIRQRIVAGDLDGAAKLNRYVELSEVGWKAWSEYLRFAIGTLQFRDGSTGRGDAGGVERTHLEWDDVSVMARELAPTEKSAIVAGYVEVLRRPESASARRSLSELLFAEGIVMEAALERRVAIGLDGGNSEDHYIPGAVLLFHGVHAAAMKDLERAVEIGAPPEATERARLLIERARAAGR